MSSVDSGAKHKKRFLRWQERVGEKTRHLSQLVEAHILPPIIEAGFQRVDIALRQPEWTVNANEIRLERVRDSAIDSIDIAFGKYADPKFQIGFSRRELAGPNKFVRSGTLVRSARQRFGFWGKPTLIPSFLWSQARSKQAVMDAVEGIAQVIHFLDSGVRGPNISNE